MEQRVTRPKMPRKENPYFNSKPKNCCVKETKNILIFFSLYLEKSTRKILVDDRCDRAIVEYSLSSVDYVL